MRRRSTFIPSPGVDYDPSEVKVEGDHLSFAALKAAREERLTFGLNELPAELVEVLRSSHELHIRWASEQRYVKPGPYLSFTTPGLHVHYTPTAEVSDDGRICKLLQATFSPTLRCDTAETSFSRPDILSARFASSASLQYYSLLPKLSRLVAWIQRNICSRTDATCTHNVALLNLADYVDFDYDSIAHALTLIAFWSKPPAVLMDPVGEWTTYDHWNLALDALPNDRNELGILNASPGSEPGQLHMEGVLTVVGEDSRPKPTMFFFHSRHHTVNDATQQYLVSFDDPIGLHPTMRIRFLRSSNLKEPSNRDDGSTCALHSYLTLPSVLFADEYAFPTTDLDPLFTEAHNILSLRSISGEKDLETPDYVIRKWGSALLLELSTPNGTTTYKADTRETWDVTIPLHLRYLKPTDGGQQQVDIPWPIVFWACTAEEGTKFNVNPFDRVNLGYDGLFGPRTSFHHLQPQLPNNSRLVEQIRVPVLDTDVVTFRTAELLTMGLVLGGFLWITWKVVKEISWEMSWWSSEDTSGESARQESDTKKSQ